jgi:succinyl-CoA synthetase beta subunit
LPKSIIFEAEIKIKNMNIHEYQGKQILKSFGVAIQEGIVADTP